MLESRAKPEIERGKGSGEGARWAPPQKIFENSYLKPCILVYSWSENLYFSQQIQEFSEEGLGPDFDPSQIQVSPGAL